jgi:hypothetical protein
VIPEFSDDLTFEQLLGPAMDIAERDDRDEAERYFKGYVEYLEARGQSRPEAVLTAKTNLGYYAGYHGPGTQEAVRLVFGAVHPVFGYSDRYGRNAPPPTADEAFEMGGRMGEKMRELEDQ